MTDVGCSARSAAIEEPMAATSPYALGWVALEQGGPWGVRALTQSHLDPRVGRALEEAGAANHVRPALIRRPGRRAHRATEDGRRHVLVAHTRPGSTWLLEGVVDDPAELLGLDLAAVAAGDQHEVRRALPTLRGARRPHLLICTNGRRDACCAVVGRPVALGAATRFPEHVWETTHTSGHRFAPTAVLLPAGTLHGRLDVEAATELLRAAERGRTVLEGSRGRSTWPIEAQAAELAVREQERVLDLDALEVLDRSGDDDGSWLVHVGHADGRSWRVRVAATASESARPESCGKDTTALTWLTAVVQAGCRGGAEAQ